MQRIPDLAANSRRLRPALTVRESFLEWRFLEGFRPERLKSLTHDCARAHSPGRADRAGMAERKPADRQRYVSAVFRSAGRGGPCGRALGESTAGISSLWTAVSRARDRAG